MKEVQISNRDYATLNRVVNSSELKDQTAVLRYLIQNAHELIPPPSQLVIDLHPAENGAYHTQEQWIALYNAQEGEFKGKRMISAPDMIGAPEHASSEALASLQKDCRESYIVTSTHNSYDPASLGGKIIHNYQSTVVRPKTISLDEIPVLQGIPLSKVVETSNGLLYVRALADDENARPPDLLKMHSILAGREPNEIEYWTPDQGSRRAYPERAVRFYGDGHSFHVDGNGDFGYGSGRSRGVLINPRSGRAKK